MWMLSGIWSALLVIDFTRGLSPWLQALDDTIWRSWPSLRSSSWTAPNYLRRRHVRFASLLFSASHKIRTRDPFRMRPRQHRRDLRARSQTPLASASSLFRGAIVAGRSHADCAHAADDVFEHVHVALAAINVHFAPHFPPINRSVFLHV
jgi:hypothetical protein